LSDFLLTCCVIVGFYALMSTVTYILYLTDKHAARHHLRRIPERRLLLVSLVGGWPGAMLAHRYVRHKSVKLSYLRLFWLMVFLHLCILLLLGVLWHFIVSGDYLQR